MRMNLLLALVAVVSLLIAPSSLLASTAGPDGSAVVKAAPSKVCHPKKPITCRAAELSAVAEGTSVSVPVLDEATTAAPAINAAICVGSRPWLCRTQTLG